MYLSVCLSVCLSVRLSHPAEHAAAAGLLLWARRAGDIDRLLHGRRSAAAAPHGVMRTVPSCQLIWWIFSTALCDEIDTGRAWRLWMYTVTFGSIGCTQVARVEIASKRAGAQSSATNDRTSWRQSKRTKNTAECNLSRHTRRWRNQTEIRRQKRTTPYNRQPHAVHKLLPQYSSYSVLQLQSYSAEKILHRDLNCFMHYVLRVYQMCGRSVPIQTNLVINSTDLAGKVL